MSKYTTEVRYICESIAGIAEGSATSVNSIVAKSWNTIFYTKVPFFDETYRQPLCQKILKHYYLREIGAETQGIWKLWMNTRLEEIMPYYNLLYKSALLDFNPLYDVDITRQHDRNVKGTESKTANVTNVVTGSKNTNDHSTITKSGTANTTVKTSDHTEENGSGNTSDDNNATRSTTTMGDKTKRDLYSDTPQGAITGLEDENYLTNARKVTDNEDVTVNDKNDIYAKGTSEFAHTVQIDGNDTTDTKTSENNNDLRTVEEETSTTTKDDSKADGNTSTTEDYIETVKGKQGTGSYSKMLQEFRETFLNIDMMIIEEFSDLFMGLW